MNVSEPSQNRLAVLIDADNAQPSITEGLLSEVAKYGVASVKRIYGDWTTPSLSGWKSILLEHSIQPVQQFRYTVGKNATDSAMIIDAMDLIHSNDVDGFCIVSSDSDYTRLATRIREEGLFVIGVGEKKTPEAFTNACNQFIYCENLTEPKENKKKTQEKEKADIADPMPILLKAFEMVAKEEEWINLAGMGSVLHRLDPAFDPRTFGHKRLLSLIENYPESFTIKRDDSRTPTRIYIALTAQ